jgi:hypothetical protein
MSSKPPYVSRPSRPSRRLVVHDIRLERQVHGDGSAEVKALVQCEQAACEVVANGCAHCKRFVRIESHEAGYVLLCHAEDEPCSAGPGGSEAETADDD